MNVRVGHQRGLSSEKLMLSNCGAGEKIPENLLDNKEIKRVNPKGKSTLNSHWKN